MQASSHPKSYVPVPCTKIWVNHFLACSSCIYQVWTRCRPLLFLSATQNTSPSTCRRSRWVSNHGQMKWDRAALVLELNFVLCLANMLIVTSFSSSGSAQARWDATRYASGEIPNHVARWERFGPSGVERCIGEGRPCGTETFRRLKYCSYVAYRI